MVLEIKIPEHNANFEALTQLVPIFLSYVLSFLYLGIYWNNHHHAAQPQIGKWRRIVSEFAFVILAFAGSVRHWGDGEERID